MHEHGTAPASFSRPGVVVDLDEKVVERIVPPEPVSWLPGGPAKWAVVAPVGRILTPGHLRSDWPCREKRDRPRGAVGAPPEPQQPKTAARRCAVSFALVGTHSGAPQQDRHGKRAGQKNSTDSGARPDPHAYQRQRSRAHERGGRGGHSLITSTNLLALLRPNALLRTLEWQAARASGYEHYAQDPDCGR